MSVEIIQSTILGIVQGLGEFLPISSTAHLILVPFFTGWEDPGLAFDVALHFGTLIAVLAYFWRDWITILKLMFQNEVQSSKFKVQSYNKKTLWLIVIATIPGALAGYFLEEQAGTIFRNPLVIAFTLSFVGLLLYLADKYMKHRKNINQLSLADVIIIGLSQAAAIVPGVSRAGATITAGLVQGLDRISAARFSFLLSTPMILGATINQIPDLLIRGVNSQIIIGIFFSALSGYLAIKYLLKFIETVSYKVFFWYRLALAVIIVFVVYMV
ncbi:undecaprenyl-diphosphatase [bacterium BMS3Abin15]|nr:undecaprenyl-diphosphatase [bacterium BMS3Abin15]HDZ85954.1 undecaprenyl-diphosphate phosphatase [Candidatus Moranbacteria bacterium]